MKSGKTIISCAVTGAIHTPSMSPYLPITADEIVEQSVEAAEAGAAVIHLHARDPETGMPTPSADQFMAFLPRIKQHTDAVINLTTGGAPGMSLEDRLQGPLRAEPEMASLNMGSMNFGAFDLAQKDIAWKHEWERTYLESTRHVPAYHTFAIIEAILDRLGAGCGTRFEFECYDIGHLYTLAYLLDRKKVEPPLFIQCIFGVLGGIGAELDHLVTMRQVADRLFGDKYFLSCFGVGRDQMKFLTLSAMMGGHVRVGLEDNLYIRRGELARSNADQVRKVKAILTALDLEIATPADARTLLDLKGHDRTGF